MIKSLIHNTIKKLGWTISRYDPGKPTYSSLLHDVPLFVTKPAPHMLDVGANKGQTIAWMKRLFPRCTIDAFEPSRFIADKYIQPLVEADSSIHLHVCALSDHDGSAKFYQYGNNELSSLHPLDASEAAWFREQTLTSTDVVPLSTVDSFSHMHGVQKIDLLKIDTQGGDLAVLKGAAACLKEYLIDWVMIEVNFTVLYQQQPSFADIDSFLAAHSFRLVGLYDVIRGPESKPLIAWATAIYGRDGVRP